MDIFTPEWKKLGIEDDDQEDNNNEWKKKEENEGYIYP